MNVTTETRTERKALFVPSGADPADAIATLLDSVGDGWLAFDIETNALSAGDPREEVRSIQLGTKTVGVALDPSDPVHLAAAREALNDKRFRLTAHNAAFDILRLTRIGVFASVDAGWARTTDTFIDLSLLVPPDGTDKGYRDLKSATVAWRGIEAASKDAKEALQMFQKSKGWYGVGSKSRAVGADGRKKTGDWSAYDKVTVHPDGSVTGDPLADNTWALVPRDQQDYVAYGLADVFDSAHLVEALDPIVRGLWPERAEAEHRAARLVTGMVHRGVRLDREKTRALLADAHERRNTAAADLTTRGVSDPSDTEAVADLIRLEPRTDLPEDAEPQCIEVTKRFRKGDAVADDETEDEARGRMISDMDKDSLKKYAAQGSRIARPLRAWRQSEKEISTYYTNYLRTGGDVIHADINTIEARTGRMSSKNPNLQNVPDVAKPCFVAEPGNVFISADFASVEMRVGAGVTGDPKLMAMYCDPLPENATEREKRARDPYWLVAWLAFGDDATSADRKLAKIICLGNLYGGGAETLAAQSDVAVTTAENILASYKAEFPVLKTWGRENLEPTLAAGRPFWTTETGRFQRLDPTHAYKALNLLIQGTARDLLLDALFRLEDAGLAEYMRLPIHDEVVFEVPADRADEIAERITAAMATEWKGVPIVAEAKVLGPHWCSKDDDKPKPAPEPEPAAAPAASEPVAVIAEPEPAPEPQPAPQPAPTPEPEPTPATSQPEPAPAPAPGGGIARPAKRYGAQIADPTAIVYADGGFRLKDEIGGCGAVVLDATAPETVLAEVSLATREWDTNNVAEYQGLIAGLEKALELGHRRVHVRLDSDLVVGQVCGDWRVKAEHLRPLNARARELAARFEAIALEWIPREQNSHADRLANDAMDAVLADEKENNG
jgi:DNA polymerase-1